MKVLSGTVIERTGQFFRIDCPDAPEHLKTLYLVPRQMGQAKVGDRVVLEYQSTPSWGLWNVVSVNPKE